MHLAIWHGQEETVRFLISIGADVNTHEKHLGFTPLHEAVNRKNIRTVEILFDAGADINATTKSMKNLYSYPFWNKFIEKKKGAPQEQEDQSCVIDVSDELVEEEKARIREQVRQGITDPKKIAQKFLEEERHIVQEANDAKIEKIFKHMEKC